MTWFSIVLGIILLFTIIINILSMGRLYKNDVQNKYYIFFNELKKN